MKRKNREYPFEVKELSDKGEFSGYLSVFNVIDAYKEQVVPGAFEKSLSTWGTRGRLPPLLWQHRPAEPLGPYTLMREDRKGLYVEGELLVNDLPRAKEARVLIMKKVVTGQSIGFDVIVDEFNRETGIMSLKEIDLWEGSIVTFPANEAAQVEAIKSILGDGKMPSLKEFEEVLRDVGFSRSQAKTIVCHGYSGLLRDVESRPVEVDAKSIVDELFSKSAHQPITVEEIFS